MPSPTNAPPLMRSILFLPALCCLTFLTGIFALPLIIFLPRPHIVRIAKLWCRIALFLARIFGGLKAEISGLDHIKSSPGLIAARHQSAWETFQLFLLVPSPVFILKKSLLNIPVFGLFLKCLSMISIDRRQGASALRDMQRQALTATAEGNWVIIFPEGTRTKPEDPLRLHPGVLGLYDTLHTPIVPVVLDSGRYWKGFKLYPGTIRLHFCSPIPAGLPRREVRRSLEESLKTDPDSLS